ncbi:putative orotidine 5'-phosphate decarboxylase [Peptoniphilus sp. oral taxon 375 str. F0436]|nr:putative orotidine 5'-phosphate decarboxylase [Peptoniphilus sp. oral taxon 375 str. F0436]
MAKDVIVALDFSGKEEAYEFLDKFDQAIYTKVGMELFYKEGPDIVREIKKRGHKVFLDLKFHDIPNTVWGAVRSVLDLDVDMVNLHIPAGKKAIQGAREILDQAKSSTILLGVTVLTSMEEEDLRDLSIQGSLKDVVKSYGKLGLDAGLHGLVCSAQEVADLKKTWGTLLP